MTRGLSFVIIFLIAGYAAAQSCTQNLNRAEDLYDAGRLLEIEGLIAGCLSNGSFSEGEQIRARKLLTKVAIFTDNEPKAESEFIELLHVDPVHQLQPEDPSEMRVLMNKFRTWPVYRLEGYFGVNSAMPNKVQEFSSFSGITHTNKEYAGVNIGIQGGARITKHLRDFLYGVEVGGGFEFRASSYTVTSDNTNKNIQNPPPGAFETNVTNSQFALRVPIFARYNLDPSVNAKRNIYFFAGVSMDYLMSAKYSDASRSGGTSFTLGNSGDVNDLKVFGQVNELNVSVIGGAGVKIGMKKGNFFFGELRFDKSLFIYNIPGARYSNQVINEDLQYVEDDLYLDVVSINVGYVRSIFKPEKLQK